MRVCGLLPSSCTCARARNNARSATTLATKSHRSYAAIMTCRPREDEVSPPHECTCGRRPWPGREGTRSAGAAYSLIGTIGSARRQSTTIRSSQPPRTIARARVSRATGSFTRNFGTAPLVANSFSEAPRNNIPCVVGCLLNLDATPARLTVFVDGEPLAVQCEYDFPKDGRAWFPSVGLCHADHALHSCAM